MPIHAQVDARVPIAPELEVARTDYGAQLIERSSLPNRVRLAEIIRLHHRRFDDTDAPPDGQANEIPMEARILSACNRFDSLVMGRPTRPPFGVPEALKELLQRSGYELHPRVVEVLIETVRGLQREHEDLIAFLASAADMYDYTAARRRLRRAAEEH